ncbi:SOS response-associated peptidase family protein [Enterococcus dongliensis]|uniref:SOS response-associated peptidase family protein n=1 Tax=Enterococcus dongliensis TaxID=2559925 RepID=UPI00288E53CA|nr:SOS response-associated peptidase family protein [Enterococcus dongliensis]MDT2670177.1 SOS response-associated peptidase family protein [Enterococcus dongliensis]
MTGFYEWDQEKNKFLFTKGQVLYVAGFYRVHHSADENEMESIIMTTQPNTSVAKIHDRMPVIVEKNQVNDWILNLDFARELIKNDMPELKSELAS